MEEMALPLFGARSLFPGADHPVAMADVAAMFGS
jgi:hypothetical protein